MGSSEEILKDLECPVCYELPSARILQCRNGHIVCGRCYDSMQELQCASECTTCRIPLLGDEIRALQVEKVIERLRTSCRNEVLGCQFKGDNPGDRKSHEQQCELNNHPENVRQDTTTSSRDEFVLLNVSDMTMCLDIPWSRDTEFQPVEIYSFVHRGTNQMWKAQDGRIVSVLQPNLCLGARHVQGRELKSCIISLLIDIYIYRGKCK